MNMPLCMGFLTMISFAFLKGEFPCWWFWGDFPCLYDVYYDTCTLHIIDIRHLSLYHIHPRVSALLYLSRSSINFVSRMTLRGFFYSSFYCLTWMSGKRVARHLTIFVSKHLENEKRRNGRGGLHVLRSIQIEQQMCKMRVIFLTAMHDVFIFCKKKKKFVTDCRSMGLYMY